MTPADCSLVLDTKSNATDVWCAYEHQATIETGKPPSIVYVGACRLVDVYRLTDGKTNSEWTRMFGNGGHVLVRIIATGERMEIIKFATAHMRSLPQLPHCNMHGFNVKGASRSITCVNNGRTYTTQRAAADDLNVSQSAISQHLAGNLKTVAGLTFIYTST